MKTDKEQMQLVGPVQRIRFESADYELRSGAWAEGSPEPVYIVTFDREGNKVDETFYCEKYPTSSTGHYETEYDAKGSIVEKTFYDRRDAGNLVDKTFYELEVLQHRLSYDEDGKLIKEVVYFADGTINHIALFEYDRHGEQTAMKYLKADGTPDTEFRYTNEYDEVGNLIKKVVTKRNIMDNVPYDQPLTVQHNIICYYE
jgi:antitoxin component YwqK of YwqJK toxin-antitoxin module